MEYAMPAAETTDDERRPPADSGAAFYRHFWGLMMMCVGHPSSS